MTPQQIIRAAIPNASDEECDFVLWNRTAFPFQFKAKSLYKSASSFQRAHNNNIRLCDFCDNKAEDGEYTCPRCEAALDKIRKLR